MLNELVNATAEAAKIDSPRGAGLLIAGSGSSNDTITVLGNAIDDAKEWALNSELIEQAEKLCDRLELSQDLRNEIATLQAEMPIVTQTDYVQFVLPVERLLEELDRVGQLGAAGGGGGMDRPLQQLGKDIVLRCQIEFWISTLVARLKDVVCATDAHEHDMKKLKAAIQKGQALRASEEVVDNAMVFLKRLDGELILSRAIVSVPTVKLPVEDPEPGYYEDGVDTGRIRETEEYPLPPVDTGTYIWECSSSYTSLLEAIEALKKGLQMADGTGANEDVIANAKAKLNKAEKDMKLLDAKDQADKQAAIDIATKAAKKLKKKKKG